MKAVVCSGRLCAIEAAPKASGREKRREVPQVPTPLGNYANNSSPAGREGAAEVQQGREDRRRARARWRDVARQITGLERLRNCGSTTHTGTGGPTLKITEYRAAGAPSSPTTRVAGYAGLTTCGSVWVCPVCAAKVAARRSDELATVIRHVLDGGGSASLVTLTMRHHAGLKLRDCWDALGYAWSRVTSGKAWQADQDMGDLLGWVKVVEATHGENGWHLHLHVLMCWDRPVSLELAEMVGTRMWSRWEKALGRKGFESWVDSGGLDVRMATLKADNLGDYFMKLAREITSSHAKDARSGRTPFAVLRDCQDGLVDDIELWREWERASKDRRQITWSQGKRDLRRHAGLGEQQTDEEIAAEDLMGADVLALPGETWRVLRRSALATDLLDAAERGGPAGAIKWLVDRHLNYKRVVRGPTRSDLGPGEDGAAKTA
ncbi:MAG: protein rep [Pseudonocardia sp.]|nr:protein rep [Pseudonocardia sp.]